MGCVVSSVRGVAVNTGCLHSVEASDIEFSYRKAVFPGDMVITGVELSLSASAQEEIMGSIQPNRECRKKTQPKGHTAGSVFKNPPDKSAGWLIDQCNLKGQRKGGALISQEHANFIVNIGGASYREVMALVDIMRREVDNRFGIELELEWKLY